jgi:hypothetical protein
LFLSLSDRQHISQSLSAVIVRLLLLLGHRWSLDSWDCCCNWASGPPKSQEKTSELAHSVKVKRQPDERDGSWEVDFL